MFSSPSLPLVDSCARREKLSYSTPCFLYPVLVQKILFQKRKHAGFFLKEIEEVFFAYFNCRYIIFKIRGYPKMFLREMLKIA